MQKYILRAFLLLLVGGFVLNCRKRNAEDTRQSCEKLEFNLFGIEKDRQLGRQVDSTILASGQYKVLDTIKYAKAYGHLQRITNTILNSGAVVNKDRFAWKLRLIHDDATLNAFCTPGGYIYVYTGIIKYLDAEDDLAGVMGHEIAHADKRHSTTAMTTEYGTTMLTDILFGKNSGMLVTIAKNLGSLKNSRCHEEDADENSVSYLSRTNYKAAGAASFFEKIVKDGGSKTPEFLSTHPSPDNRVESINNWVKTKNDGNGKLVNNPEAVSTFADFKASLP